MDISIIIPVHNLENYIQPLLSTLWNQKTTGIHLEYIFVFDSCTDDSYNIVQNWSNKLLQSREGISVGMHKVDFKSLGLTRNHGLEHSTGHYIWFIDGDDWLLTDHAISTLYNSLTQNNLSVLRFGFMSVWKDYFTQPGAGWMMVWQYVYKRELIEDIKFPSTQPDEDVFFTRKVFEKVNFQVPLLQQNFYFYNYGRSGSIMMTQNSA